MLLKDSAKKEKKANENAEHVKHDLLANLPQQQKEMMLKSNNEEHTSTNQSNKKVSTQQKDVFYHSFKNIRDRYQFKEQRTNNIQMQTDIYL